MDWINAVINALLLLYFAAFSWAPPVLGLTLLGVFMSAGILFVIRRTSDPARMKAAKDRVWAALFELRVYADEPRVTWKAQKSLLSANLRYMALAMKASVWVLLPMALLLLHLEAFYGRAPLVVGREAIVTMGMASDWDAKGPPPELVAPPEVRVTGPPVRALDVREVSWRIEPVRAVSGSLTFLVGGRPVHKMIEAGTRQRFVAGRSVSSAFEAWRSPDERRIPSPEVEWIEIGYPAASLPILGIRWNWLTWFFVVSFGAALLLKKRFGVVI